MAIIYAAINNINHKLYIGKTTNDLSVRKRKHLESSVSKKRKTYFHSALRKYGNESFDWIILEEVECYAIDEAECFWIAYFRSIGAELYNLTNGGDGLLGFKHSEETKRKIKSKLIGVKHTLERSENVAKALAKTYTFTKDGNVMTITNLRKFCKEHGYDAGTLIKVYNGKRKSAYGFTKE